MKEKRFSIKDLYGQSIINLWKNHCDFEKDPICLEIKNRGFAVQSESCYGGLMFIGINPSYNGIPGNLFYNNGFNLKHPYYKRFFEIGEQVDICWSHVDLLFIRETSQKVIKKILTKNFGDFLHAQYEISKNIIETAKPKIIVVNNTIARDMFLLEDYKQNYDEILGTNVIVEGILKGTPVFYCSMLTGKRALDNGSYERLIWHIKYVLKNI